MISRLVFNAPRFVAPSLRINANPSTRAGGIHVAANLLKPSSVAQISSTNSAKQHTKQFPDTSKTETARKIGELAEEFLDNAEYGAAKKLFKIAHKLDPENHSHRHLSQMAGLLERDGGPTH